MMFLNDQPLKTIDIDLNSINLVDVQANEKIANEVDDTFGFGNIIEDAIKDKIYQNRQKKEIRKEGPSEGGNNEYGDSNYGSKDGFGSMGRKENFVTAIVPCNAGFLLGVSGGLLCFYDIEKNNRKII